MERLAYAGSGSGADAPTVRPSESGWMWQRDGLAIVHAPSSVLIDLNRACTSFDAVAGLDRLSMGLGAVRFLVYGDQSLLYASRVADGGSGAVPVHADLTGHRTLRLVVARADGEGMVDMADWAASRINCR
ncbi:protein of unknown function [Streptantibioticus cattleyicolor NRRL 8057 = DSM 46488]|uniref:NPCBM/NEW2 domain-containing protein n=1 Tax=Streptomyces sp. SID5468 TaxID=2690295 RepID=UPI000213EF29|nr:regulator [Streptomyces sp. SID5468]CCB76100.1 protein of unknown function [Streptantibioticus cattleyicolor NRRL 8057 = DSM 46488]